MPNDNAALVRGAYEAFGRGDVPAVMALFADDIAFVIPSVIPHARPVNGKAELGAFFQGLADTWSDFGLEIDDVTGAGERVYATGRASGVLDGTDTSYGFVHIWTLRDGVCVKFDEYADPSAEIVARAAAAGASV